MGNGKRKATGSTIVYGHHLNIEKVFPLEMPPQCEGHIDEEKFKSIITDINAIYYNYLKKTKSLKTKGIFNNLFGGCVGSLIFLLFPVGLIYLYIKKSSVLALVFGLLAFIFGNTCICSYTLIAQPFTNKSAIKQADLDIIQERQKYLDGINKRLKSTKFVIKGFHDEFAQKPEKYGYRALRFIGGSQITILFYGD